MADMTPAAVDTVAIVPDAINRNQDTSGAKPHHDEDQPQIPSGSAQTNIDAIIADRPADDEEPILPDHYYADGDIPVFKPV